MLNTDINFLFKNVIALCMLCAKTQLLSFIHTVQIDLSITHIFAISSVDCPVLHCSVLQFQRPMLCNMSYRPISLAKLGKSLSILLLNNYNVSPLYQTWLIRNIHSLWVRDMASFVANAESESECKCLTCNQKPSGSQFQSVMFKC